ncbi:multidrug effflux MFS transporter [Ponticaulis profundi]|uniref:Bcr/CflA family efflux transporter n=1 Tax=Ponticaulis profundi TaxID=2665222 RepID=A0ABW1SCM7_9PROT
MSATPQSSASPNISTPEFVAMTACLMALNALAIDVMLPAMSEIGRALNVSNPNDAQFIVVVYMFGFGFSQLVWGPVTDRFGRKRVLTGVLIAYVLFSLGCTLAQDFTSLLIWRFCLGIASGGTRVIATSVVRDLYVGRGMARIMSLVMTVFMVVPILAPMLGQQILYVFHVWQSTFGLLAAGGFAMLIWSFFRLPETRPPEDCTPIDPASVLKAYKTVFETREALGYVLGSGIIFGALFAFVSSSEQIFNDVFKRPDIFVYCFAIPAAALSIANFTNSRIVEKLGQRRISHAAVIGFSFFSLVLLTVVHFFGPNLVVFMALFALIFMNFGFIGPNFNSMAMEPLGRIAGVASGLLGFATTTMAAAIGGFIAHQFNGTLTPVVTGYVGLGLLTLIIVLFTEKGKLFSAGEDAPDKA